MLRRQTLEERNEGREIQVDEVSASLLADLQMEQDKETEVVLINIANMVRLYDWIFTRNVHW